MGHRIYTRSGDKGQTGLYSGERVDKDDIRIECLGAIDEVNSSIGWLRAKVGADHDWDCDLRQIQVDLMDCMAHIATSSDSQREVKTPLPIGKDQWIEQWIDKSESKMQEGSEFFLLPGGNEVSALCHVIRTQFRKAERRLVSLQKTEPLDASIHRYLNRLSDLFFTLAREELERAQIGEEKWKLFSYGKMNG